MRLVGKLLAFLDGLLVKAEDKLFEWALSSKRPYFKQCRRCQHSRFAHPSGGPCNVTAWPSVLKCDCPGFEAETGVVT